MARGLLKNWVVAIRENSLYKIKLPLGVFLEPDILLNTLKQKTCRHIKKPLDELEMHVTFGDLDNNNSPFVMNIGDVQLEGGNMVADGIEVSENKVERQQLDNVAISFVEKAPGKSNDSKTVELPLYLTYNKEMMLFRMKVPVVGDKNDIILSGSAFYVQ